MRAYRNLKASGGFTLMEVLAAMVILGIGVIAIMELFPPSMYMARLAADRIPTAAKADREFGILRAWGVSPEENTRLLWPVSMTQTGPDGLRADAVGNAFGAAYMQYNLQALGIPAIERSQAIYSIYRVTLSVPMMDGRHEKFVTLISKY